MKCHACGQQLVSFEGGYRCLGEHCPGGGWFDLCPACGEPARPVVPDSPCANSACPESARRAAPPPSAPPLAAPSPAPPEASFFDFSSRPPSRSESERPVWALPPQLRGGGGHAEETGHPGRPDPAPAASVRAAEPSAPAELPIARERDDTPAVPESAELAGSLPEAEEPREHGEEEPCPGVPSASVSPPAAEPIAESVRFALAAGDEGEHRSLLFVLAPDAGGEGALLGALGEALSRRSAMLSAPRLGFEPVPPGMTPLPERVFDLLAPPLVEETTLRFGTVLLVPDRGPRRRVTIALPGSEGARRLLEARLPVSDGSHRVLRESEGIALSVGLRRMLSREREIRNFIDVLRGWLLGRAGAAWRVELAEMPDGVVEAGLELRRRIGARRELILDRGEAPRRLGAREHPGEPVPPLSPAPRLLRFALLATETRLRGIGPLRRLLECEAPSLLRALDDLDATLRLDGGEALAAGIPCSPIASGTGLDVEVAAAALLELVAWERCPRGRQD